MLIISQNKDVAVNSNNVFAFYIDKNYKHTKSYDEPLYDIQVHGNFKGSFSLGEFSTMQKALAELEILTIMLEDDKQQAIYYMG